MFLYKPSILGYPHFSKPPYTRGSKSEAPRDPHMSGHFHLKCVQLLTHTIPRLHWSTPVLFDGNWTMRTMDKMTNLQVNTNHQTKRVALPMPTIKKTCVMDAYVEEEEDDAAADDDDDDDDAMMQWRRDAHMHDDRIPGFLWICRETVKTCQNHHLESAKFKALYQVHWCSLCMLRMCTAYNSEFSVWGWETACRDPMASRTPNESQNQKLHGSMWSAFMSPAALHHYIPLMYL